MGTYGANADCRQRRMLLCGMQPRLLESVMRVGGAFAQTLHAGCVRGSMGLVRIFLMVLGGLLWGSQTFALPSSLSVGQFYHSQWTARDGAPTAVTTLAQTRDGFLWLGTDSGLFRFDGVQFSILKVSAVSACFPATSRR